MTTVLCLPATCSAFFQGAGWSSAKSTAVNGWPVEALNLPADRGDMAGLSTPTPPTAVLMSRVPSVLDVWSDKWCAPSLPRWRPHLESGAHPSSATPTLVVDPVWPQGQTRTCYAHAGMRTCITQLVLAVMPNWKHNQCFCTCACYDTPPPPPGGRGVDVCLCDHLSRRDAGLGP